METKIENTNMETINNNYTSELLKDPRLMELLATYIENKKNEDNVSWDSKLQTTKKGNIVKNAYNYKLWIENASMFANKLRYNSFSDYIEYDGKRIRDIDIIEASNTCGKYFNDTVSSSEFTNAYKSYANDNAYNPLLDYLNNIKWDGEERLETFIIKCLDAEDNELNRFFTRKWMIGAVKRAYEPGCKFDNILVLQGGVQGSGKTTLFRKLTKDKYYNTFASGEFLNKDSIIKMNNSLVVLLDEFDKFSDREIADLKCKITETMMSCRKAYDREISDYKVHWVYAATTNSNDFLCDLTGDEYERRYWIIECNKQTQDTRVDDIMTNEFVDQLWAEAVHYYLNGENELFLSSNNPLYETYKSYQRNFKKTSGNDAAIYLEEILNKKYKVEIKGKESWFIDSIDMEKQFNNTNSYDDTFYINKVPCAYVTNILRSVYGITCRPKTIKSLLLRSDEWELKEQAKYKGKNTKNVICRINRIDYNKNDNKAEQELPF